MEISNEKLVSLRVWAVEAIMGLNAANRVMPGAEAVVWDAQTLVDFVLSGKSDG
jgi:hypothetical protein